ncbi:hypothetical protein [Kitasatospora sp. NPDC047058]|uniref:hypothetical protein n=1 Tax=Kitasatospora sp. NPDC047058 TaxID=3155620 RepID=UPI0033D7E4FB
MPVENDFEGGFALALRGAAELAPEPVLHALAAGAERRGRRRRNQRRAVLAGGLAALVLATGSLAAFGGGVGAVLPADDPARQMSAEEAVQLTRGLLPPGSVRELYAETPGVPGPTGDKYRTRLALAFDDGKGESILIFTVDRTELTPDAAAVCLDPFNTPKDSCDRTAAPDGSVVVVDKLRDRSVESAREWRATWAAADGRRVEVIEYNGQSGQPDRENPPLDADQLRALVSAPAWDQVLDALPRRANPPKASAPASPSAEPTAPAAEVLARLVPLLPPGTTHSEVKGGGTANLSVTSEDRTSLLSVTVEAPGARGLQDKQYAESEGSAGSLAVRERMADGSTVVVNQFGNGKTATTPVLHWSAAVYYPDGRKVEIFEQNGENGYTARPGTPALSLEQLKAIVTAPSWRS